MSDRGGGLTVKWLVTLLLAANLVLFLWGWFHDAPLNAPFQRVTAAPGVIHLLNEVPPRVPDQPPPTEGPAP